MQKPPHAFDGVLPHFAPIHLVQDDFWLVSVHNDGELVAAFATASSSRVEFGVAGKALCLNEHPHFERLTNCGSLEGATR